MSYHGGTQEGRETILVVDDEAVLRKLVVRILEASGYNVLEAPTGEKALSLEQDHDGVLHLLITDIKMPGMNGKQLADRLGQRRPQTKVLFISGYAEDVLEAEGIGPDVDFLSKPFSPARLVEEVRRILGAQTVNP